MKKILLFLLIGAFSASAYMGDLHSRFVDIVPEYLNKAGYSQEADTVSKYLDLMRRGAADPDNDYPGWKIPADKVPDWMKPATNTSVGKWEHTLVNDLPREIEDVIKIVAKKMNIKYQYADKAIPDWLGVAEGHWHAGRIDSAIWYLGRTCHLIQDITVPMHCRISGNLMDVWNVYKHQEPNHSKFENYCSANYIAGGREFDLEFKIFEIPDIAGKSRKYLKYCDGVGGKGFLRVFNAPPLRWIFPWFVEDYEKAMKVSTARGEEYTVKLIHYFFQKVKYSKKIMENNK